MRRDVISMPIENKGLESIISKEMWVAQLLAFSGIFKALKASPLNPY